MPRWVITPLSLLITELPSSASLLDALEAHWREYLMEATELGALMLCICLSGTLIYSRASPIAILGLASMGKAFLMGIAVAISTFLIIRSPFGRRSGAHFNPAISLAYFYLGRMHRWDTLYYIASQFTGAVGGVFVARWILGEHLSGPPVRFVITIPGVHGDFIAFAAEFVLSGLLMALVLFTTNHRALARFSPMVVALVTVFYYGFCSSISGFSVNPARSFSSAMFAWVWRGIWVYFAAPSLGMLAAAYLYIRSVGREKVYCAKVFHDLESICPFACNIERLYRGPEGYWGERRRELLRKEM
jgi:aquaporin Z